MATNNITDIVYSLISADETFEIKIGSMPVKEGVGIYFSANSIRTEFYDKRNKVNYSVFAINSKFIKQKDAINVLEKIHDKLTFKKCWFDDNDIEIVNIQSVSLPVYIGQEENEQYMYGSSIGVLWYKKNMEV